MVITISASSYEALHFCRKQKFLKQILVLVSYYCLVYMVLLGVGCVYGYYILGYTPRYKSGYVLTLLRALVKKNKMGELLVSHPCAMHISRWGIRISAIDQKEATRLD